MNELLEDPQPRFWPVNELQDFSTLSATQETQRGKEREREREGGWEKEYMTSMNKGERSLLSDSRPIIALAKR